MLERGEVLERLDEHGWRRERSVMTRMVGLPWLIVERVKVGHPTAELHDHHPREQLLELRESIGLFEEMDKGRRGRLARLGFSEEDATSLSSLPTRNFM
jgi:hypothetical protein